MNFLGIDIGTSSICGIVYNTVSKDIVSIAKINNTDMLSCNVWEKVQDANAIVDIVLDLIQELRIQYPDIKGIGLSGQLHGILYVNAEGEAVSPLYTWQDMRGSLLYKDGMSYAAYLSKQTGFPLSTGFGLVTHYYNKVNSLVPQNAVKLCTIMDYTAMRLTGKCEPLVDCSNAASLGFFDKEKLAFDKEALWNVGIDNFILPEIGKAFSRVGHYENISVYTAIGDNQASFLGSIRDIRHSIHITVGTSSQISVYSDDYVNVPLLDTRPLPGGGYILVGAALCGGCSFSLLKKFFSETIKLYTGEEMDDTDLYKIMVSVPYKEVQEDDIRVETLFGGTRSHPEKRGKIMNISCLNWHPENLIRGFLEGMSQELYDFYQLLPNSIRERKTILVGSGNGIKRNPLLCQILEERFKCHLQVSACREEAALGACICGMVGNGYINNFTDFFNENLLIN